MPATKRVLAVDEQPKQTANGTGAATSGTQASGGRAAKKNTQSAATGSNTTAPNSTNKSSDLNDASSTTQSITGISWADEDLSLLQDYRRAHRLDAPSAFSSHLNQFLLTNRRGIGRQSPTMVHGKLHRTQRKTSKAQLALAVRKDFNNSAVNEMGTAVEMLYKARHKNHTFKLRPYPLKGKQ